MSSVRGGRRCVLSVHAHPDDESTKGAAAIARYAASGVRCVLVCCTDGSAGEPGARRPHDLAELRAIELDRAAGTLGYESIHHLDHPDSGMDAVSEDGFANLPIDAVVNELVSILRDARPDVILTYDDDYAKGHPDHQRTLDATRSAFERLAADPNGPAKLYGTRTHTPAKLAAMHTWLTSRGLPSPYVDHLGGVDATTTRVEVTGHLHTARDALLCHASQVAPDDPWFFAVPAEAMVDAFPYEELTLLASRVDIDIDDNGYETDLFSGLP